MKKIVLLFALVFIYSCTPQDAPNTFRDNRDGKVYKTATIGEQVWMVENLAYLPSVVGPTTGSEDSSHEADPYYYVYGYNGTSVAEAKSTQNYKTYGVLYNWNAAKTGCPDGWHLPSNADLTILTNFLGGASVADGKLKESVTSHWYSPNTGATNSGGFSALPGGGRGDDGIIDAIGEYGGWWTSTHYDAFSIWVFAMASYSDSVVKGYEEDNPYAFSVSCLRD
ncbi:MAG: FISUMP domain-containing protein [Candidatus Paceibacterota bacterium]|jgi:uncharacterized protein (TIGR02145 family)|nr:FISUMP domain-containing protein [Bacteroidales bacterium]